jgi:hypothetical protein
MFPPNNVSPNDFSTNNDSPKIESCVTLGPDGSPKGLGDGQMPDQSPLLG